MTELFFFSKKQVKISDRMLNIYVIKFILYVPCVCRHGMGWHAMKLKSACGAAIAH